MIGPPPTGPPRAPRASGGWHMFAALGERDYAWFFAGNSAFFLAMQMNFILRGFLAFDLTGKALALAVVSVAIAVPMLVVAPFGGVVADRFDKRRLLVATQSVAAAADLVVAFLVITDAVTFWHLVAAALVTGIVFAVNMPARQAMVPQLVPQHKLMNAISLQMGGMNLTRIIGPAAAGLLIAPLGVGGVYLITAALFGLAVASEFQLPAHGMIAISGARRSFREDLLGGFAYISRRPLMRLLIVTGLLMPLFSFPVQQMLPVFAEDVFAGDPFEASTALGVLAASTGVGGLAGALIAANLDGAPRKGRIMLIGGVLMGVFLIAFAATSTFIVALLFLALANLGGMLFMTTNNTVIQASVDREVRGRVMSVLLMSFGVMPLGVVPVTVAADAFGAPAAVAGAAVVMLAALLLFFAASARLRGLEIAALGEAALSPAQAARMVAEGRISSEEAERLTTGTGTGEGEGEAEPEPALVEALADEPLVEAPLGEGAAHERERPSEAAAR